MIRGLCRVYIIIACLWLAGCASSVVVPTPGNDAVDPAAFSGALADYNQSVDQASMAGKMWLEDGGALPFGARSARGQGARLDAVTGAMGQLVLQLACRVDNGCLLFLPGRRTAYQADDLAAASWITELLLGRVALDGEPDSGWRESPGDIAVRYLRPAGGWITVVFGDYGRLPSRVYYTDSEGELVAHVRYSQFARVGEIWFPSTIEIYDSGTEPQLTLALSRFEPQAEFSAEVFSPEIPPSTRLETQADEMLSELAPLLNAAP